MNLIPETLYEERWHDDNGFLDHVDGHFVANGWLSGQRRLTWYEKPFIWLLKWRLAQ